MKLKSKEVAAIKSHLCGLSELMERGFQDYGLESEGEDYISFILKILDSKDGPDNTEDN